MARFGPAGRVIERLDHRPVVYSRRPGLILDDVGHDRLNRRRVPVSVELEYHDVVMPEGHVEGMAFAEHGDDRKTNAIGS